MKLLTVDTIEQAREKLLQAVSKEPLQIEYIEIKNALGRILAEDLVSPEAIPQFRRSTVDGYAVKAQNTQGVSESVPVFLKVIETVRIGRPADKQVEAGQCTYVPTGGMVPAGADAMVMVEYCESFDETSIAIYDSVSPGRNIIGIGEDVKEGTALLTKGTKLRPQEIGVLSSTGVTRVPVYRPWKITIISTGDELVAAEQSPGAAEIRDINTPVLEAMSQKYGFEVLRKVVLKDEEDLLRKEVRASMEDCDLVAVSGGSSQGEKDYTAKILDELGNPGVFTHGIALKPGKPTILGYDKTSETVLMGLPGHPAAAMLVFELMAVWLHRQLTGQEEPRATVAQIETNVASAPGKATCQLVELIGDGSGYTARPIFGKSGLMTTLTKAHGYTMIAMNKEGLKAGEEVKVVLF